MSIVTGLDIPPESEDLFFRSVKIRNRYSNPRIDQKSIIWRKRNLQKLIDYSQFVPGSTLWDDLSDYVKLQWAVAGYYCGLTGYQLFMQDTIYRLENSIEGLATPSPYHQYKVGTIVADNLDGFFHLDQLHNSSYYIKQKNVGKKNSFSPVLITESFAQPFVWGFSIKTNLVSNGDDPACRVYINFYYMDGGNEEFESWVYEIPLVQDWSRYSYDFPDLGYDVIRYQLVILLSDVDGSVFFDNYIFEYGGVNYAIDPHCDNIKEIMTAEFVNCQKPWIPRAIKSNVSYDSVYIS